MKKLIAVGTLAIAMVFAGNQKATAQAQKFGFFDDKSVLSVMPGIGKVDTALAMFQQDSLNSEKEFRTAEFYRNDSTLKADSVTLVKARIYDSKKKELIQQFYLLQNWDQYAQQQMQAKQAELLQPFNEKLGRAYQAVVKEHGYTWVFKTDNLYTAPQGDNLIPMVLDKLGIKLPKQPSQGQEDPAIAAPAKRAPVK